VMESGTIYYAEKSSDTVFQIVKGNVVPFVSGLTKPAYLYCVNWHSILTHIGV